MTSEFTFSCIARKTGKQRQKRIRMRPKAIPWDPEQRLCSKPGYIYRRTLAGPVLTESRHKMAELGPHRSDALLRKCKLHTPQNSQTRHTIMQRENPRHVFGSGMQAGPRHAQPCPPALHAHSMTANSLLIERFLSKMSPKLMLLHERKVNSSGETFIHDNFKMVYHVDN